MPDINVLFDTMMSAINSHDDERLIRCLSPRAVFVSPAGVIEGHEQIGWYYRQLFMAFPDACCEIGTRAVHDDTIVTEWTFRGTHTGALLLPGGTELIGTGRRVALPAGAAYTMDDDGVFASGRIYYDQLSFFRQTGHGLRLRRDA